jgi:surfeit locus 1 family protein
MNFPAVFRPAFTSSIVTAVLFCALIKLGFWQLDRAALKTSQQAGFQERSTMSPVDVNIAKMNDLEKYAWRKARVTGTFLKQYNILLDNQVYNTAPGYYVFTPLIVPGSDVLLLVNRGWLPAGPYRDIVPGIQTPEADVFLTGSIKLPPAGGLVPEDQVFDDMAPDVLRAQRIRIKELEEKIQKELLPVVFRLDSDSQHGYTRDWQAPGFGIDKHKGYAFQWFALAGTLLVLYLSILIRKTRLKK